MAELGDKSQLLLLTLVMRFQRPVATLIGLVIGTLISQSLAVALAQSAKNWVSTDLLQFAGGVVFLAVAIVLCIAELRDRRQSLHRDLQSEPRYRHSGSRRIIEPSGAASADGSKAGSENLQSNPISVATVIMSTISALVFAEFGDKTQFVVVGSALAHVAHWPVIAGASAAMVTANLVPIFFGAQLSERLSARAIRWFAIISFAAIGIRYLVLFRSETRQLLETIAL